MRLPFDYSRCAFGENCPLSNKCARWVDPGRPGGPQSFTFYPGGEDCHGFIEAEGGKHD